MRILRSICSPFENFSICLSQSNGRIQRWKYLSVLQCVNSRIDFTHNILIISTLLLVLPTPAATFSWYNLGTLKARCLTLDHLGGRKLTRVSSRCNYKTVNKFITKESRLEMIWWVRLPIYRTPSNNSEHHGIHHGFNEVGTHSRSCSTYIASNSGCIRGTKLRTNGVWAQWLVSHRGNLTIAIRKNIESRVHWATDSVVRNTLWYTPLFG